MSTVWSFELGRVRVALQVQEDSGYQYDGDDSDGETQSALDRGDFVAFDSRVIVEVNGHVIGADSLGGSVYESGKESEFWTAHRDRDPMQRNCSEMRAASGSNVCICHYFPDMVRQAIADARATLGHREAA